MTVLGKTLLIVGATLIDLTPAIFATHCASWLDRSARLHLAGAPLLAGLVFGGIGRAAS